MVPQALFTGDDILLNDVPFNHIDVNEDGTLGCIWLIEDIEGWWGHADLSLFSDERTPYEDGEYYTSGRYNARQITITGSILPPPGDVTIGTPQAAVVRARNTLNRAISLVRSAAVFRVNESDAPKRAVVQISEAPLTSFDTISNRLAFSITLKASDPRKYSADAHLVSIPVPTASEGRLYNRTFPQTYGVEGSSGVEYVYNAGTYKTPAKIRIHGPVADPGIHHHESGSMLRFDVNVGLGKWLDIDLQSRTAFLESGESARGFLEPGSKWFQLEPGINTISYTGTQTIQPQESAPELVNLILNPGFAEVEGDPGVINGLKLTGYSTDPLLAPTVDASGPHGTSAARFTKDTLTPLLFDIGGLSGWHSPVDPSTTYNASIYVKPTVPTVLKLGLLDDTGSTLDESADIAVYPNVWTRIDAPLITGASTTSASMALIWADEVDGEDIQIAAPQLTEGSTLWPDFYGGQQYTSWEGAPNASVSIRKAIPGPNVPLSVVELSYRDAWIY